MLSLASSPVSRELISGFSEFRALMIQSPLYSVRLGDQASNAPIFCWDLSYPSYGRVKATGLDADITLQADPEA